MMTREGCASFEPIESRAVLAGLGLARSQAELPSVGSSTNMKKSAANEKLDELSSDDEESVQGMSVMRDFLDKTTTHLQISQLPLHLQYRRHGTNHAMQHRPCRATVTHIQLSTLAYAKALN